MPYILFPTSLGTMGLAYGDAGLTAVALPGETDAATKARVASTDGEPTKRAPPWIRDLVSSIQRHLEGDVADFSGVPLDTRGLPDFAASLYRRLQAVPSGRTMSYGDLAASVGSPGAARAVGAAMGKNPFPLVVPCHRVLAAGGKIGGFSAYGGKVTKTKLLELEGRTVDAQVSLFAATTLPFDHAAAHRHLAAVDPVLARHIAKVGRFGLALKDTDGTFGALAEAIVYQQLGAKAAGTIFGRLRALFPRGRLDAASLLAMSEEPLRAAGVSGNKQKALRDLAERTIRGEIPTISELHTMDDETIIERLTQVRGIGRWTVEMLLIFRLGRPDVFPIADYGVQKGFTALFARSKATLASREALEKRAARWRPYRSVATWYLWRAAE